MSKYVLNEKFLKASRQTKEQFDHILEMIGRLEAEHSKFAEGVLIDGRTMEEVKAITTEKLD